MTKPLFSTHVILLSQSPANVRSDPKGTLLATQKEKQLKATIKTIAAVSMMAFAAPAFAGGVNVYDDGESKLKVESLFYLNTTMQKQTTQAGLVKKTTGLAVDRAYLTLKYTFNENWMMRLTTDVANNDATLAAGGSKSQNIYLKYAYVEGKLMDDAVVLRLGQSHTPWIDYEQGLWGHRYVAKTMIDQLKFDDSSDLGIGLKGKLGDGLVEYWVTETTGAGYGNAKGSTNGTDLNARIGVHLLEGLTLDAQFRDGYHGTKTFTGGAAVLGTKSTLTQVMATYGMGKDFRVGVQYVNNKADNKTTNISTKDNGFGAWGWASLGNDFGAFAKYEGTKTKVANIETLKTVHLVGGVEYTPVKNITFSLAVDQNKKTAPAGTFTKDISAGLYSQIKF